MYQHLPYGVPEGEEREQGIANFSEEIMMGNFHNMAKEIDIEVQEAQRVSDKMNPKRSMPRHIIIKVPKIKDKGS